MTTLAAKLVIRDARAFEAELLSVLAMRSKGYWRYDTNFMTACEEELTYQGAQIYGNSRFICKVAASSEVIAGFYLVKQSGEKKATWDLEALFVEPKCIGLGIGRRLMEDARESIQRRNGKCLYIESDPHAEAFYLRCGAKQIGKVASGSIPGRTLPFLRIDLS